MSKLGWSYPAGAENDPNAPYNQTEEYPESCPICSKDNADDSGDPLHSDGIFCSRHCESIYDEHEAE
jgi:hypothetical protein